MTLPLLLFAAFAAIALVGTALAALHDAVAARLERRSHAPAEAPARGGAARAARSAPAPVAAPGLRAPAPALPWRPVAAPLARSTPRTTLRA